MRIRTALSWLALPLLLVASVATAQTTEIEIGYRWLDLDGSEAMYRSQINEDSGFILRSFIMTSADSSSLADRYTIHASDLGDTPAGMLRVEAAREGKYLLRVGYRTADAFSAIPSLALGQHSFDRSRSTFDVDLDLVPGRRISPFVGYTYHRTSGPGLSTYFIGQDEFRITSDLRDTEQEIRAGANFAIGRVTGQITQGWRDFSGRELFSLDAGEASGNNSLPILGRDITISSFNRDSRTDVSAPFTNAFITGDVHSRVKLIGSFVHLSAENDGFENEALTGSFVSFPLSRFFNGLNEDVTSRAKNTTWRGEGRAEISLTDGIDLIAGYRREHRELDGTSLFNSLFSGTTPFGGSSTTPTDLEEVFDQQRAIERNEDTLSATLSARALGPFALRAGYSEADQEVTLEPGTFDRKVRTFDTSGTYAKAGLTLGAAWRHDTADRPIFRTDFTGRDRIRLRASYGLSMFRVGLTAEDLDLDNDELDYQMRQYTGDVTFMPLEGLQLHASASQFEVDSTIDIRRPQTFLTETSLYVEEGTSYNGGVTWFRSPLTLDINTGRFENEGTSPFTVDRLRARVVYDFLARMGVGAEWSRDEFTEERTTFLGNYDATRYGLFLRYRP